MPKLKVHDYGSPQYLDGALMRFVVHGASDKKYYDDIRAYVDDATDARLFAAAPEMLTLLRRIRRSGVGVETEGAIRKIEAKVAGK